ncbi:hypothetical protein LCGC14_1105800 [marine sediment metagenome]|uniref:Uncharacterized protein n=1 Tax=marine sediment metagenome TaxID=412755 RepID=A0A0F9MCV8_9ZZZZ
MAKTPKPKVGYRGQIRGAFDVAMAIKDHGIRDDNGELMQPYKRWVDELERDIEKMEKWLAADKV